MEFLHAGEDRLNRATDAKPTESFGSASALAEGVMILLIGWREEHNVRSRRKVSKESLKCERI